MIIYGHLRRNFCEMFFKYYNLLACFVYMLPEKSFSVKIKGIFSFYKVYVFKASTVEKGAHHQGIYDRRGLVGSFLIFMPLIGNRP